MTAADMGGVPTAEITVGGIEPRHVVLYFHGGVYVISDAFLAADLASQIARRTQAKVISVDYRLAPEHPYPAAWSEKRWKPDASSTRCSAGSFSNPE